MNAARAVAGEDESGVARCGRPLRADARRNVEALLAAAREAFERTGPNASLDDIARTAGVGPGTLYRHFPNRLALLEAVYGDTVDRLCAEGEALIETEPPADALIAWLKRYVGYVAVKRGLATALVDGSGWDNPVFVESKARIHRIGGELLTRAKDAGAVNPDAQLGDVLRLVGAIAHAGEGSPEGAALSERLLQLAIEGLRAPAG